MKNGVVAVLFLLAYSVGVIAPFMPTPKAEAALLCQVDISGANDVSNQKDVTKMCVDYANAASGDIGVAWNWDDLGSSGANTLDGCTLYDSDGNGFADYAVCVATTGNPAVWQSTTTYTCGDTRYDRCTSTSTIIPSGATVCNISNPSALDDPFPAGDFYPKDTKATCLIDLTAVGGLSTKLINVCSYPSGQPNSDPSDCIASVPKKGKLEVVKNLVPAADPGLFNLLINDKVVASNVSNGGTTGEVIEGPGTYTVGETAGTGTTLSGYTTSISCRDLNGTGTVIASGTGTSLTGVTVNEDTDVICVITNTAKTGTITVTKQVTNNNGGSATPADFPLYVNQTQVTSGVVGNYAADQSYTVSETAGAVTGYAQTSAVCTDAATGQSVGLTFTLLDKQNVNCVITNDDIAPTLTLVKKVTNNSGGTKTAADFQGKIDGNNVAWSTPVTLNAGAHAASETTLAGYLPSGWTGDCAGDGTITLALAENKTCYITNDDQPATLNLVKTVVNNNGGSAIASDFPVFIGGTSSSWGSHTVNAGSYTVSETSLPGYTPSAWGGDCTAGGSVTLGLGETKTCTITNDDNPASISGTKYEVNAGAVNGTGGVVLSGWIIFLDTNNNGILDSGERWTVTDVNGNYSFDNLIAGGTYYPKEVLQTGWTQIFGATPVTPTLGQTVTAKDFGNFRNAKISGHKWNDVNGDGQWQTAAELGLAGWTIFIDANSNGALDSGETTTTTAADGSYVFENIAPGTYSVCEVAQTGWLQIYPAPAVDFGCHSVTVALSGQDYADRDFGNQGRGTITVIKNVDTDGDGVANYTNVGNWTWDLGADDFATGTTQAVSAGTYTIHEDQKTDYHFTSVVCNADDYAQAESVSVTVSPGENVVCTFTNTRDTGTITVVKEVTNDDGGTAGPSDFKLYVNGQQVTNGVDGVFNSNVSYDVSENAVTGYQQKSIVCMLAGVPISRPFTLLKGQHVTCTITNDDVAPKLTVVKHVVNTGTSNTSTSSDFTMLVNGTNVSKTSFAGAEDPGTTVTLDAGAYSVSEAAHSGYTMTTSGACSGTIAIGEEKTCTITNTAILYPGISVVKDGPDIAHEGDDVIYSYDVTNTGNVPFTDGAIEDLFTGDATVYLPTYVSGDSDDDDTLGPGETWHFELVYTIPAGQTADVVNTVTACGYYYDPSSVDRESLPLSVCDEDDHTLDVLHPNLQVVKSGPANVLNGTTATYTFTVTNTGDTPLDISSVVDDVAGLGIYKSGDVNNNGLLDLTETWIYQASKVLLTNGSVKNTVTVCAVDELEGEVCSNGTHTTIVYTPQVLSDTTPKLEDTGASVFAAIAASITVIGLAIWTVIAPRRRSAQWSVL